jgi:hypothetical protein
MGWQVKKYIPPVKKGTYDSSIFGSPGTGKFQLYVYEKGGLALGVVTQLWDITPQPLGYLSKEIDEVAKGWPGCLWAFSEVSLLVSKAQKLILHWSLTVYTLQDLGEILNSKGRLL